MKTQDKFLAECAKRTPIMRSNPIADFFGALLLFALLIVANFL